MQVHKIGCLKEPSRHYKEPIKVPVGTLNTGVPVGTHTVRFHMAPLKGASQGQDIGTLKGSNWNLSF